MRAIHAVRSICPCGESVLKDDVPIGKEYDIDPFRMEKITFICGGCHTAHENVLAVFVHAPPDGKPGYLPVAIFRSALDNPIIQEIEKART